VSGELIAAGLAGLLALLFGGARMALNRRDRRDAAKLEGLKGELEDVKLHNKQLTLPLESDAGFDSTLERMLDDDE
jgi:hypothetical protein